MKIRVFLLFDSNASSLPQYDTPEKVTANKSKIETLTRFIIPQKAPDSRALFFADKA